MDATAFLRTLFAALAGTWFGAGLFHQLVFAPTIRAAGPHGLPFSQALAKRHGTGWLLAILAVATTLAGIALLFVGGIERWTALAVALVGVALALGATVNRVAERDLLKEVSAVKGAPSAAQRERLGKLGARSRVVNPLPVIAVGLALALFVWGEAQV